MAEGSDGAGAFEMVSLKDHLPKKRKGLSVHFSGRSRSFASISDASSVDDLKKPEIPEAKRRKYSARKAAAFFLPPASCRTALVSSSSSSNGSHCVGV